MAMLTKRLPPHQKSKALFVGVGTGVIFRIISVLIAGYLIQFFWLQIIGGVYLLYLAIIHIFFDPHKKEQQKEKPASFWKVVFLIEITDILFAIDSILAAFALAGLYYPFQILPSKIWVIYLGGVIGLVSMRFAAKGFIKLIHLYPSLEKIIFLVVGWMGIKLIVEGFLYFSNDKLLKSFVDSMFWMGSILIFIVGFLSTKWDQKV